MRLKPSWQRVEETPVELKISALNWLHFAAITVQDEMTSEKKSAIKEIILPQVVTNSDLTECIGGIMMALNI